MAKRSFSIAISDKRCRSCGVCWAVCRPDVLTWQPPLNKAIIKNPAACTGCRLCEWLCPDFAIVVKAKEAESNEALA